MRERLISSRRAKQCSANETGATAHPPHLSFDASDHAELAAVSAEKTPGSLAHSRLSPADRPNGGLTATALHLSSRRGAAGAWSCDELRRAALRCTFGRAEKEARVLGCCREAARPLDRMQAELRAASDSNNTHRPPPTLTFPRTHLTSLAPHQVQSLHFAPLAHLRQAVDTLRRGAFCRRGRAAGIQRKRERLADRHGFLPHPPTPVAATPGEV